jgi:hypothetical protein
MNTNRKTAIIVGVLYIIGTVAGILSVVFTSSILNVPDLLMKVSANENQMIMGALFVLIMGLALAMVPVMMYPILKKQNEALALGYVVFRGGLETVNYIITVIGWYLLLLLSQAYVQVGALDTSAFPALGTLLLNAGAVSSIGTIVFVLGALMFYSVLYQSKLIPRWISGWGLIAAIPYLVAGFLFLFGLTNDKSALDSVLRLPLGLQEMVMAVWLIAKGFNPAAIASLSSKQA